MIEGLVAAIMLFVEEISEDDEALEENVVEMQTTLMMIMVCCQTLLLWDTVTLTLKHLTKPSVVQMQKSGKTPWTMKLISLKNSEPEQLKTYLQAKLLYHAVRL